MELLFMFWNEQLKNYKVTLRFDKFLFAKRSFSIRTGRDNPRQEFCRSADHRSLLWYRDFLAKGNLFSLASIYVYTRSSSWLVLFCVVLKDCHSCLWVEGSHRQGQNYRDLVSTGHHKPKSWVTISLTQLICLRSITFLLVHWIFLYRLRNI